MQDSGIKKKSQAELLKAVDECLSIGELCDLVKNEGLVIQMQSLKGASNNAPKKLSTDMNSVKSPLDTLKDRVRIAIVCQRI